ncbi:MAG: glucose-6-phosphate isomerase [Acidobacteriales bacterium]|nr:glucose-6-phosphate isomerase [Terriglobales bacterium]
MNVPIRFNAQHTLKSAVGDHGLDPSDFDAQVGLDAVVGFRKRVDSGEVGFPNLPMDQNTAKSVEKFASRLRSEVDAVLVLGIGGSALGPYALDTAIRGPHPVQVDKKKCPKLYVMDNVDPGFVSAFLENLNPKKTAVCVIAKSGGTAETLSTFLIVHEWIVKAIGAKKAVGRFVAVTDEHKGDLLAIAKAEKYQTFYVPADVGGRFSVLTPVGLLPAALIGLDIKKLLHGAHDANQASWSRKLETNPALQSALVHHALDTKRGKKIEIVFAYSAYLWGSAFWYRQLWAESLGKRVNRQGEVVHTGQTPVAALGVTDQHSQVQLYAEGPNDKMITFWAVDKYRTEIKIPETKNFLQYDAVAYLAGKKLSTLFHAERTATEAALTEAGRPNCRWVLPRVDEYYIGAFFQLLEFQTAFCGELYGINAFDQPGVELAKKITNGLMGRKGFEDYAEKFGSKKA